MITVVGGIGGISGDERGVAGLAAGIALAAAARGSRVELVSKLGDDPAGDRVLFALTRARVGHAAILRDPARATPMTEAPGSDAPDLAPSEEAAPSDEAAATRPGASAATPGAVHLDLAPADLELALRYLTEVAVIVLADPVTALVPVAVDGAGFVGAALVIVGPPGTLPDSDVAPGATVLVAPDDDAGGAFATLVAEYAVELDGGREPAAAWAAATRRLGAEPT